MNTTFLGFFRPPRCSSFCLSLAVVATLYLALVAQYLTRAAQGQNEQKPAFQYQLGDIRVSIPSADEPRVKSFGPNR